MILHERVDIIMTSNITKPQTTLPNAKVIKKIGKWTVEEYINYNTGRTSYAVSDGWLVHYPIIYDNGNVAYDNPYVIPKSIKDWFERFASKAKEKGSGWHGDTPGHKAAANKNKLFTTLRMGLKKDEYTAITKADNKDLANARLLGISAFLNGNPAIPLQDKLMNAFLKAKISECGHWTIPYMKAWMDGWHYMNLMDMDSTNHRQLTEKELNRMIDLWASAPLTYKPEIDTGLMELGLVRFWDDTPDAVENTDREIYGKNGQVLEEWYDFKTHIKALESCPCGSNRAPFIFEGKKRCADCAPINIGE